MELPSIPSWTEIMRSLGFNQGVTYDEEFDSHIREYNYVNQQAQNAMVQPSMSARVTNWVIIGAVVLGGVYVLKKIRKK